MNVVIYARFSSHSQTEQSIEGQLKECYRYAEQHNYTVVGEYIDRAISGKFADNRTDFLRMISDSDKHTFEGVLVYQEDELFYRVQEIMNRNKTAPARTHGEGEYLLTTKLFCGHCKEMMVGYGGTGKAKKQYHYYICKNARKKKCDKKIISKSFIENRVIDECLKMLTDDKIKYIAKMVAAECSKSPDNLSVKELKKSSKKWMPPLKTSERH